MPKTFSLHGVFEFLFCKCCFAVAWTHSWTRMNIETSKLNSQTLLNVSIYGKEKHLLHPSDNDDDCNWNTPLSFYILQLTSLIFIFIYLHLLIWNCALFYGIMNPYISNKSYRDELFGDRKFPNYRYWISLIERLLSK